jgi:hypothetical protein
MAWLNIHSLLPFARLFFCIGQLLSNLNVDDMYRVFQGGSVAAYEHIAMIRTQYRIANSLDTCLQALSAGKRVPAKERPTLRLEVHRPPVESIQTEHQQKASGDETLSTHSSLDDDDDDDDTTSPGKWENIPTPAKEQMGTS